MPGRSTAAAHSPAVVAAAARPSANEVTPAPGLAADGRHRAPLQRAAGQELAERARDLQHALAREHHRRALTGHLVQVRARDRRIASGKIERMGGGKCRDGHRLTLANVCSIHKVHRVVR